MPKLFNITQHHYRQEVQLRESKR